MKKLKVSVLISVLSVVILLSGCASTNSIESAIDPSYIDENIDDILVMFRNSKDIRLIKQGEAAILAALKENDITSYASYELIPLTKEYSQVEFNNKVDEVLESNNIRYIIFVNVSNIVNKQETRSDMTFNNLSMDIEFNLVNVKKEGIAWKGIVNAEHSNATSVDDIIKTLGAGAKSLIDKLKQDNLI